VIAAVYAPDTPILLPHTMVEAHLIAAEAALLADDGEAGRRALELALVMAETIGVTRPLALAGPGTQELLSARVAGPGTGPFAAQPATAVPRSLPTPLYCSASGSSTSSRCSPRC
jgi:LuxR family maltose regulon positive regulatory protein